MAWYTLYEALESGIITDIRPLLSHHSPTVKQALEQYGISYKDMTSGGGNLIVSVESAISYMIDQGHGQQYYEDCKKGSLVVRLALAQNGLFWDELIHDPHEQVRITIFRKDHSYMKFVLDTKKVDEYGHLADIFSSKPVVNFDELAKFRQNRRYIRCGNSDYEVERRNAMEAKWETRNIIASTLEATMSPWDLFLIGSPVWKINVPGKNIAEIERYEHELRAYNEGKQIFDDFLSDHISPLDFKREMIRLFGRKPLEKKKIVVIY